MKAFTSPAVALAALLLAPCAYAQTPNAAPRYAAQIQAELQAMGLAPQCASTNNQITRCTTHAASAPVAAGAPAPARRFVLNLQYDDGTDTVYVYIDHYATLRSDLPNAGDVFRRLLAINWEMLVGKFEWSQATNELRLSAVLNTDSNFDRRAFRGLVFSLLRLADSYGDEVARLTGAPVGETTPAPAAH